MSRLIARFTNDYSNTTNSIAERKIIEDKVFTHPNYSYPKVRTNFQNLMHKINKPIKYFCVFTDSYFATKFWSYLFNIMFFQMLEW